MFQARADPLVTITEVVADAADTPIEDLPALRDSIDPDALVMLLADDIAEDVTVTFTYAGRDVLVSSEGIVYVWPPEDSIGVSRELPHPDES